MPPKDPSKSKFFLSIWLSILLLFLPIGAYVVQEEACVVQTLKTFWISYRLAQMEEAADTADEDKAFKILQHIIPDLVINGRSLSGNGFLAGRKSVADLKTLSPCDLYSNDRTGNPVMEVENKNIEK